MSPSRRAKAVVLVLSLILMSLETVTPIVMAVEPDNLSTLSQTFESKNILVDESHVSRGSEVWTYGNACLFGWLLKEHGYNVSMNWDESLDGGILDSYDILCLFFPQTPLTTSEVDAVHDFVDNGGGLLLVGVDYTTIAWAYTPEYLNPISQTYGITFNNDQVIGRGLTSDGDLVDHAIAYDVDSYHTDCNSRLYGCSLNVESPATTVGTILGNDMLAVAESGSGRVVAIGTPAIFAHYRKLPIRYIDPDDHFQISLNVIDWLARNSRRVVDPPEKAIIRVGAGPALNESELDAYTMYNGVYHEHTTVSDGMDSPEVMVMTAYDTMHDYFVMIDHTYTEPLPMGVVGGQMGKEIADKYGLEIAIIAGAELSAIPHTVGVPMTENIFTESIHEAITGIHAQGGIAILAHPTVSYPYMDPWTNFESYGYDAFEVDCEGFFGGLGEAGYFRPFVGSLDSHSRTLMSMVRNVVFVENPTGPDGTLSPDDFRDAVVNKRVIVLDRFSDFIYGQAVWVDRFLAVWDEAEIAIEDAQTAIATLEGQGLELSRAYLGEAIKSLQNWNPSRALRAARDAASEAALGINIDISHVGVVEPNEPISVQVALTNNHSYAVGVNITPWCADTLMLDQPSMVVEVQPASTETIEFSGTSSHFGYTRVTFILNDLNASGILGPSRIMIGGVIKNITTVEETDDAGIIVTIGLLRAPLDNRMATSYQIEYDDGSGRQLESMVNYGDRFIIELGPYSVTTNVTYTIIVSDILGNVFRIDGFYHVNIGLPGLDVGMLVIAGGSIVAVAAIVIFRMRGRKES